MQVLSSSPAKPREGSKLVGLADPMRISSMLAETTPSDAFDVIHYQPIHIPNHVKHISALQKGD